MRNIHTIAAYFLYKTPMRHKKLQKLCYYAQVWHLAHYKTPLMPNRFEACVHSPGRFFFNNSYLYKHS